ncbi:MAG: ABC transporter ATP-binding protein, partial [Myxococcota bacterium]|nr:ABC transporter ATP-binding protein [Myxococcota bacterium]
MQSSIHSPVVRVEHLSKVYGSAEAMIRALDDVSFEIGKGEFVAVMGPSGSGKSTCMNLVGCLDRPSAGSYRFADVEVGKLDGDGLALLRRQFIAFVFQSFNLLARTSAVENVELPLVYMGVKRSMRRDIAIGALQSVGLEHRLRNTPAEMSGGEQQRVAIARALVGNPLLLVADEPTGNLDTKRSNEIMDLLCALNEERKLTILMVTHEPDIARFAKRVMLFVDG